MIAHVCNFSTRRWKVGKGRKRGREKEGRRGEVEKDSGKLIGQLYLPVMVVSQAREKHYLK